MSISSYLLDNINKDLSETEKLLAENTLKLTVLEEEAAVLKAKVKELLTIKKALASIKE